MRCDGTKSFLLLHHHIRQSRAEKTYQSQVKEINTLLLSLEKRIISPDSRILFTGIQHSIHSFLTGFERNITETQQGDTIAVATTYEEAKRKLIQLNRNVNDLLLEEIRYIKVLQTEINTIERIGIATAIGIIVGSVVITIVITVHVANTLIHPIQELSDIAKVIAEGNLQTAFHEKLLKRHDEIGSLSTSFQKMVDALKKKIVEVEAINTGLQQAQQALETKTLDLEKMNNLMIGRELKMIELKQLLQQSQAQVALFKEKLKTTVVSPSDTDTIKQTN